MISIRFIYASNTDKITKEYGDEIKTEYNSSRVLGSWFYSAICDTNKDFKKIDISKHVLRNWFNIK